MSTPFCAAFGPVDATAPPGHPDLTPCFQQLVLALPLAVLLLLATPFVLRRLASSPAVSAPSPRLLALKLAVATMLIALAATDVALATRADAPGSELLAGAFTLAATVAACVLHMWSHTRLRHGAGVLLAFWLGRVLVLALDVRSRALDGAVHEDTARFALLCAALGLTLLILVLECLPKPRAAYRPLPSSLNADVGQGEDAQEAQDECPEDIANVFSRLAFWWLNRLVAMGHEKPLQLDTVYPVPANVHVARCARMFAEAWRATSDEQMQGSRRVLVAAWASIGQAFVVAGLLRLLQDALSFAQPQLLAALLDFLEVRDSVPVIQGYLLAVAMFLVALVQSLLGQQYFHLSFSTGVRLRTSIVAAVYDKALRLSGAARQQSPTGQVVNLMSVDAQRLMDFSRFAHNFWAAPLVVVVAVLFLYQELYAAVFVGVGCMLVLLPLDTFVSRRIKQVQKSHMANKDARMKLLDEIVASIRTIKLNVWEDAYRTRIGEARACEMTTLKAIFVRSAWQAVLWSGIPVIMTVSSLGAFVLLYDEPLTPTRAFVSLSLFALLQAPLSTFPATILSAIDAYVALGRLGAYFTAEEVQPDAVERLPHDPAALFAVRVDGGEFQWHAASAHNSLVLSDIRFACSPRTITAVVGQVGSGKSMLVSALLGDLVRRSGTVSVRGRIAYVPQQAWIMNASLRDNVVFCRPFDQARYDAVLAACDLLPDLAQLPGGDATEIGERGITLSGGQRQRVSLARAAYAQADVCVLDDPLSALDRQVAAHVFEQLLGPRGMLAGTTRILVTHRLESLDQVNQVLVMREGHIVEQGTYAALLALDRGIFAQLVATYAPAQPVSTAPPQKAAGKPKPKKEKSGGQDGKLMAKEDRVQGEVSWKVYAAYAHSVGATRICLLLAVMLLVQAATVGMSVWLQLWSSAGDASVSQVGMYLSVYAALGLAQVALTGVQALAASVWCGLHAAQSIYQRLFEQMLRARMQFFETTPLGRILNRFSKDVDTIDLNLPRSTSGYVHQLFVLLGIFAAIIYATPAFAPVVVVVGACYWWMQRYFMPTKRDLKRLDSILRSPTIAHFTETLHGIVTIRAFDQQDRFISVNRHHIQQHLRAYFYSIVTNRWQGVRMDVLGAAVILVAAILVVATLSAADAALGGIVITYALQLTAALNVLVRTSAETETHIIAVERAREYDSIPLEAPAIVPECRPPPDWPREGAITFHHYSTRYRDGLDLVLNDVDIAIRGREKVGVVGRTGAGKSTLLAAIPRLVEPVSGSIEIDGIDATAIGLADLRPRLAAIAQDPVLLAGTLRDNLDPLAQHSDEALWRALACAQLDAFVRAQPDGLLFGLGQHGSNLSVGQRQLVCLTRALLHRARIVLLDEATAAVDVETDERIQRMIRTEFVDSTIITIAHRLNTVLDNDRILVLSEGRVMEFDAPAALLSRADSVLSALARS